MPKDAAVVSKKTFMQLKEDSAKNLAKLREKVKLANENWGETSPAEGLAAVATGTTYALLNRWKVRIPGAPDWLPSVAPLSLVYTAAWPMVRKGLSKGLRRHGDRMWQFGLAQTGYEVANQGFDALLSK